MNDHGFWPFYVDRIDEFVPAIWLETMIQFRYGEDSIHRFRRFHICHEHFFHVVRRVRIFVTRCLDDMAPLKVHKDLLLPGKQAFHQKLALRHRFQQFNYIQFLINHLVCFVKQPRLPRMFSSVTATQTYHSHQVFSGHLEPT